MALILCSSCLIVAEYLVLPERRAWLVLVGAGEALTQHRAILMSVEPSQGQDAGEVLVNPPNDHRVAEGDTLVVVSLAPVEW